MLLTTTHTQWLTKQHLIDLQNCLKVSEAAMALAMQQKYGSRKVKMSDKNDVYHEQQNFLLIDCWLLCIVAFCVVAT